MEVIKRRPNLEETEKRTHEKNAKKLSFWVSRIVLNDLYQIIAHLNTLTHPLGRQLLQK